MPPTNDRIEQTLIGIIAFNIQMFLFEQRRMLKNDGWFTVAQIADELYLPPYFVPFYSALKQLAGSARIERFDGQVRYSL